MAFVPGELVIITLIERKGRFWGGNNRLPRIITIIMFSASLQYFLRLKLLMIKDQSNLLRSIDNCLGAACSVPRVC